MATSPDGVRVRPAWFVGAWFGPEEGDQTPRFLKEGIWENGYTDQYIDLINSIEPGDRIAIKSQFNRTEGLPFDSRGHKVSVMAIKAIGTVKDNMGDGRHLEVEWTPVEPVREWCFYTYVKTVWKVVPGKWTSDSLIGFTFDEEQQDIDSFRNYPYWKKRFGDEEGPSDPPDASIVGSQRRDVGSDQRSYTVDDIVGDGCFIERSRLESMLERLQTKKNLILQGPPGTGKTWLAKKLAFALLECRDDRRVRPFQFHPNLSYEDFVRGWRPDEAGRLKLVDGPFLQVAEEAKKYPTNDYVIIVEEINRSNPAQIFGEMLTLLEADKRNEDEALALGYPRTPEERVFLPDNLYLIGTMNLADRSIALVDLALRRRFAFVNLDPIFGARWRNWVQEQCGLEPGFLQSIEQRLSGLNESISNDSALGPQFQVGHSVVTPPPYPPIGDPEDWFKQVVETEIGPLLEEYWFDNPAKATEEKQRLMQPF